MKLIPLSIILALIFNLYSTFLPSNTLFAQNIETAHWSTGKIQSQGAYTKERDKIGHWKYYYANGQLEAEGKYTGKSTDKAIELVKKTRNSAISDDTDVREGLWTFFYENSQLKARVSYNNGCPEGKLERWHDNGNKSEEAEIIDCKPIGNRKNWDKNGVLFFENVVQGNGQSIEIEWYPNNQKKSEIPYRDGQQYGKVKRWYPNGQKEEEVSMRNTRVHGLYRSWYDNGQKKMEFTSINNVMSGEYREWYANGNLSTEIIELEDKKQILVKQYWDNGQLKVQGTSNLPTNLSIHNWTQTRQGIWTYWLKDGTAVKTENYTSGVLVSTELAE